MFGYPPLDTRLTGIDRDVRDGPAVRWLIALMAVLRTRLEPLPAADSRPVVRCLRRIVHGKPSSWATYLEQAKVPGEKCPDRFAV